MQNEACLLVCKPNRTGLSVTLFLDLDRLGENQGLYKKLTVCLRYVKAKWCLDIKIPESNSWTVLCKGTTSGDTNERVRNVLGINPGVWDSYNMVCHPQATFKVKKESEQPELGQPLFGRNGQLTESLRVFFVAGNPGRNSNSNKRQKTIDTAKSLSAFHQEMQLAVLEKKGLCTKI